MRNPFRYFKTSPEVIHLAVMMYIRFPLSLRQVEDLLHERGIDICHETVRFSPPTGDNDVTSQVDRLSSSDTKIALRSLRTADFSSVMGSIDDMVASKG